MIFLGQRRSSTRCKESNERNQQIVQQEELYGHQWWRSGQKEKEAREGER